MFIPLYDHNKIVHIRYQWATLTLVLMNIIMWLITLVAGMDSEFTNSIILGLGFIPSVQLGTAMLAPELIFIPEWMNFFSYAFVHAGLLHLGGNILFLWVFSDNVEDALGHGKFIVFYGLCAAAGALCHGLLEQGSDSPLIGASGAAAGVASAYLLLHPRVRVWVLVFGRIPLPLPSYAMLSLWILFQIFMLFFDTGTNVSWGAHVGGIIAGALLVSLLKRKGVQLLPKAR